MSLFNKNRKKENYKHEEKDESVKIQVTVKALKTMSVQMIRWIM